MVFNSLGAGYLLFSTLHLILLVLAAVTAGLYGVDLNDGEKADGTGDGTGDGRWVFAVVVAGISALTALLYLIPFVLRFMVVWIWDFVLFVLWIAVFGVFGKLFIREPTASQRMTAAVWINLASALLWLITALAAGAYWWRHRERRSRFTGRAKVY